MVPGMLPLLPHLTGCMGQSHQAEESPHLHPPGHQLGHPLPHHHPCGMAIETPSPLSAPSWMTLNPSTPSIQWRTSLLQKSINIFKEYTPAKQTELPVEPHLSRPFSGEAWHSPAPQEKDGPPLLRWLPNPNPCMRAPAVFLQCNQP